MNFTQEQLDTIQLPIRWKRIKLEVLNTDFQTLATIEGNAIGGSLQKDATNFVRRTGSVQMCVPNVASATAFLDYIEGVTININGKIWLDKYVKIWVGIDNYNQPYGDEPKTVWYNFGICLIDAPVRTFGANGYTMEFNVIDLASKMNGDRSGQLAVTTTLFPRVQGYDANDKPIYTSTEQALASCIEKLTEFKRYTIYPIPEKWATLPYDIKMEVGSTVYTALEQFLDILSGWQMYFDNEGIFVVEPIPSGANDIVYPLNLQLNTQDVNSVDFNNVRNQVIVYGRSHNIDFYADSCMIDLDNSETVVLHFDKLDIQKIFVGSTVFGFKAENFFPDPIMGRWLEYWAVSFVKITYDENGTTKTLVDMAPLNTYGTIDFCRLIDGFVYVFRVKDAKTNQDHSVDFSGISANLVKFEFLGRQQSQGCVVNGNKESPYSFVNNHPNIYYGEARFPTLSSGYENTQYTIQLTSEWDFGIGDIITFFAPFPNWKPTTYLTVWNKDGDGLGGYITNLSINQIGTDYTIWSFQYTGTEFAFMGQCPYVNTMVESGGEYNNIYADSLAMERAEYDLFLHSNMQNTITLSCVPDYAIDVNYRIKYNPRVALPPDANLSDNFEDKYFITKMVTYPLGLDGSAQTINAIEIYDDYNYVGYAYDVPTGS